MIEEPPRTRKHKPKRYRPDMAYEWKAKLSKLVKQTVARDRADVVRRAVMAYIAIIEQQQDGWSVVLKKGTEEKPFPVN